jgi:hypothetical protein
MTTPGTGYTALTWATTGTVTQGAGNTITFATSSTALLTINKSDAHISVVASTTPGAANNLYMVLAGNYLVDIYNGTIYYKNSNGNQLFGVSNPSPSYTQANGDTMEAIYTTGLIEVWSTSSGVRVKINSVYVGRLLDNQTTCGLESNTSASIGTLSAFNLRY